MSMIIPNLEELVPADHHYRKLLKLVDFEELTRPLKNCYSNLGRSGYPISSGFKCLLIQATEDLSDRQLEAHLRDSLSAKLFCGFTLTQSTPDHSYFSTLRDRIGTKRLAKLFSRIRSSLKEAGLMRELFTFVDATKLESRVDVWKARDKAIEDAENNEQDDAGRPTMNNRNVSSYCSDPEARFGCKGKRNIWLGYKRHVSVDMTKGLINKVAVTPANVPDSRGLKHICPSQGMVFGDKAYCERPAQEAIARNGCHSGAILKNNMRQKNRDKDRWLSAVRMPFEGIFAHQNRRARYRGLVKTQFQAFLQAMARNFSLLTRINSPPLALTAS